MIGISFQFPAKRFLILGLATVIVSAQVASAQAFQLLSHRAIYELSLLPGRGGDISGVSGRMVLEWADACEGYTTQQRMVMRLTSGEGKQIDSDFRLSSWEDKSGESFRFDVRTAFGKGTPEVYKGRATRSGSSGKAKFRKPDGLSLKLPRGVVFPSEHIARLIDKALAGESRMALPVFDGTGKGGLFETVGLVLGPDARKTAADDILAKGKMPLVPAWRVRLSFFDYNTGDSLPSYEVSLRLFANGVADRLVLDYSDFAVVGTLKDFTILEGAGC
jgi:hypothetical protein